MYLFSEKKRVIFVTYMQKRECVTVPIKYNFRGIKRKDQCLSSQSEENRIQKEEQEFLWMWIQYQIYFGICCFKGKKIILATK